ncbi:restriction endonuclease subunit S [Microbacterium schleiferi]|uniref:restriction endonuclease subunit S n=1 Tax=Microbacterium schleiferi TaxID=69362 RepID=UPI003120320A
MRGNHIDFSQARRISEATFSAWTRRLLPRAGDLLLAREAPVGPVVRVPDTRNVAPGQRTVLMRPDPEVVDPEFLYYFLTSPTQQSRLVQLAEGSTVPHLNVADVKSFPISNLPGLRDQRAISEVLGAIDRMLESIARRLLTIEELLAAQYERVAAHSESVTIGSIAVQVRQRVGTSGSETSVPVVLSAVSTGHLKRSDDVFNKQVYSKSLASYLVVPEEAIAYNPSRANIGSIGINEEGVTGAVSPVYVVAEVEPSWRQWLRSALRAPQTRAQIDALSSGSVRQALRFDDFASIMIPAPGRVGLDEYSRVATTLRTRSRALQEEGAVLRRTRDTLLPELLSGRVRVADEYKMEVGS